MTLDLLSLIPLILVEGHNLDSLSLREFDNMSDPANRIALWGTIGTWLSPVYGPVVTSIWSYMVEFFRLQFKPATPQEIDLEAALPSSEQVRELTTAIRFNTDAVKKQRDTIEMIQQTLEEISKLMRSKSNESIPTDPVEPVIVLMARLPRHPGVEVGVMPSEPSGRS